MSAARFVTLDGRELAVCLGVADEAAMLGTDEGSCLLDAHDARRLAVELTAIADALDALADDGL